MKKELSGGGFQLSPGRQGIGGSEEARALPVGGARGGSAAGYGWKYLGYPDSSSEREAQVVAQRGAWRSHLGSPATSLQPQLTLIVSTTPSISPQLAVC